MMKKPAELYFIGEREICKRSNFKTSFEIPTGLTPWITLCTKYIFTILRYNSIGNIAMHHNSTKIVPLPPPSPPTTVTTNVTKKANSTRITNHSSSTAFVRSFLQFALFFTILCVCVCVVHYLLCMQQKEFRSGSICMFINSRFKPKLTHQCIFQLF